MKYILLMSLFAMTGCVIKSSSKLEVGQCVLRRPNGTVVLTVRQVLDRGYILEHWRERFDHTKQENVLDLKQVYRGRTLVNEEYDLIDCEASDVKIEDVDV